MHVVSTITSTRSTHDVPVLVLASIDVEGTIQSRKFVARPARYADLLVSARQAFNFPLDVTLVFGTSTLDVCRGAWIEIDESAYPPLLEFLDEVTVRAGAPQVDRRENDNLNAAVENRLGKARDPSPAEETSHNEIESNASKARQDPKPDASTSIQDKSTSTVDPPGPSRFRPAKPIPVPPVRDPSEPPSGNTSTRRTSSARPNAQSERSDVSTPLFPQKTATKPDSRLQHTIKAEPIPEPELNGGDDDETHRYKSRFKPQPQTRLRTPEPVQELELTPNLEPTPKAKPRFNLEPQPESKARGQRKPGPKPVPAPKPEPEEEEEEEYPEEEVKAKPEPFIIAGLSHTGDFEDEDDFWRFGTKTESTVNSSISRVKEEPPSSLASEPESGSATLTNVVVKAKAEGKPKKIDRSWLFTINPAHLSRASTRPSLSLSQESANRPDVRFMAAVYGPKPRQGAEFKTRGGHKVRKVLESVCKTFGFPYERSRLLLVEEIGDEDRVFNCDPEDTIAVCGVGPASRLWLHIEGLDPRTIDEEEEEEEEEDEDEDEDEDEVD